MEISQELAGSVQRYLFVLGLYYACTTGARKKEPAGGVQGYLFVLRLCFACTTGQKISWVPAGGGQTHLLYYA